MAEHIERELAISEIDDCFPVAPESEFSKGVAVGLAMARIAVCHIPAADVRPVVRGVWRRYSPFTDTYECSNCGEQVIDQQFRTNFCPNCGADMRETSDEKA